MNAGRRLAMLLFAGAMIFGARFARADDDISWKGSDGYAPAPSQSDPRREIALPTRAKIVVIGIDETVELGLAAVVRRAVDEARKADALVLDINTLGGRVDAAIQIRDALLRSKTPTIAFIDPRAISAGALIALACDRIFITSGGTIGAATPIQQTGELEGAVAEKMTSYMRTEMRSTAEARGRRGDIAEAMVDREVAIKGITESGKSSHSTPHELSNSGLSTAAPTLSKPY
ncbi:MAG: hypothetical protein R3A47_02375 [Polyangiales bacterium]